MMSQQIYWDEHKDVTLDAKPRDVLIRDIPQKWLARICDYMVENSFRLNRLYTQLKIHDIPNVEEYYRRYVKHVLHDECSIMVIDEETSEIFGVALVKLMTKEWRSWTIWLQIIDQSTLYGEFMLLRRMQVLNFEKEHPEHEYDSLHLFEYYLRPELKANVDFMTKFFNVICEVARHMLMPRVSLVGTMLEEQQQAETAGFQPLSQLIYSLVEVQGLRAFQTLRDINEMYMVLYERSVEPLMPFYCLPPPYAFDEEDRRKHEPYTVLDQGVDALDTDSKRSLSRIMIK
ncbi:uncharacterized protein LOC118748402 [Rhagoletis pomonella]|uniref:uncharacterized protein LOC118748402 n=1 Tax=Rhagoletis pomonella TaxID=28610 RepID=UPI001780D0BE|nr:uncharacterized protein LOC118748402 [Rhagoletis pomonella]